MLDARAQCSSPPWLKRLFLMSWPIVTSSYRSTARHGTLDRRPDTHKKITREHPKKLGTPQVDCSGDPRPWSGNLCDDAEKGLGTTGLGAGGRRRDRRGRNLCRDGQRGGAIRRTRHRAVLLARWTGLRADGHVLCRIGCHDPGRRQRLCIYVYRTWRSSSLDHWLEFASGIRFRRVLRRRGLVRLLGVAAIAVGPCAAHLADECAPCDWVARPDDDGKPGQCARLFVCCRDGVDRAARCALVQDHQCV